jgi:hypothetical protein
MLCPCVNCRRWSEAKSSVIRGTKGKEQWEASKRLYKCMHVEEHTDDSYHSRDNVDDVVANVALGLEQDVFDSTSKFAVNQV